MTHQIIVYCDGRTLRDTLEPSHPKRRANVARLEFIAAGEDSSAVPGRTGGFVYPRDMWVVLPVSRRGYNARRSAGKDARPPTVDQDIAEDGSVIDLDAILHTNATEPEFHIKGVLRCPLCGLDLQFRTAEAIAPQLDVMRHADVREVSLAALAAILPR